MSPDYIRLSIHLSPPGQAPGCEHLPPVEASLAPDHFFTCLNSAAAKNTEILTTSQPLRSDPRSLWLRCRRKSRSKNLPPKELRICSAQPLRSRQNQNLQRPGRATDPTSTTPKQKSSLPRAVFRTSLHSRQCRRPPLHPNQSNLPRGITIWRSAAAP